MKNIRLDLKDLFDDRVIYLAEPGIKAPIELKVIKKKQFSDANRVLFTKVETGTLLMLTKLALPPTDTSIRMFAKIKQARRWCERQPEPIPVNSADGSSGSKEQQDWIISPSEVLAEDKGFFDPV